MEKDKDLAQLFAAYRPQLGDSEQFMQRMEQRMRAVECLKEMQCIQRRQHRRALLAAFVMGIAAAIVVICLGGWLPQPMALPAAVATGVFGFVASGTQTLLLCALLLGAAVVITVVVNLILEVQRARLEARMRQMVGL